MAHKSLSPVRAIVGIIRVFLRTAKEIKAAKADGVVTKEEREQIVKGTLEQLGAELTSLFDTDHDAEVSFNDADEPDDDEERTT